MQKIPLIPVNLTIWLFYGFSKSCCKTKLIFQNWFKILNYTIYNKMNTETTALEMKHKLEQPATTPLIDYLDSNYE